MPCIKQIDEMLCIEHEINSIIKRNKIISNRWNERCADSILGQFLSLSNESYVRLFKQFYLSMYLCKRISFLAQNKRMQ